MPFHLLGGFWVFITFRALSRHFNLEISGKYRTLARFFVFIGLVMLVGVLWEFWEFILDRFLIHSGFTYLPGVYEDTLKDL